MMNDEAVSKKNHKILFGCDTNGCTDFTDFTDEYGFFVPKIRIHP
jgi:hypothetical protein